MPHGFVGAKMMARAQTPHVRCPLGKVRIVSIGRHERNAGESGSRKGADDANVCGSAPKSRPSSQGTAYIWGRRFSLTVTEQSMRTRRSPGCKCAGVHGSCAVSSGALTGRCAARSAEPGAPRSVECHFVPPAGVQNSGGRKLWWLCGL